MSDDFRVYSRGEYPKPKKLFVKGEFLNRQKARNYCRNHPLLAGWHIVHPDGTEEPYTGR